MAKVSLEKLSADLVECYREATRKHGLIAFTQDIRTEDNDLDGKRSVTQSDLSGLFSSQVWLSIGGAGGHRKLKNCITGIVVEYANHGNSGGIDPGSAEEIFHQVQKHLNILCNEIFCYTTRNWKEEPDYVASAHRYVKLHSGCRYSL